MSPDRSDSTATTPTTTPATAPTTPTITAIVVSYNTREFVLPLIGDLLTQLKAYPGSDVVVVDNASSDGTVEVVKAEYPEVRLEAMPANLGFAKAVNRAAEGSVSRWLLLVNPDARIDPGSVSTLVERARNEPGHGLYGGRFVDMYRGTNEDSVAVVPTMTQLVAYATGAATIARRLGHRSAPRRAANAASAQTVDALPGTFLLIENNAWQEVGGFDERYFMYGEDLDLSVRVARTGRRPMYVPSASVRHAGGASSSSGTKEVLKLTSLVTFLHQHWTPNRARLGEFLLLAGVGLRRAARLPKHTPDGRFETAWRERGRWRRGW